MPTSTTPTTPTQPKAYIHPTTGNTLLPLLRSCLPHSLPLYRRLQFQYRTPTSLVLASFAPRAANSATQNDDCTLDAAPRCFAAAFVDRSQRPSTEAWLFVSGEVPGRCSAESCSACAAALLAVLRHMGTLPYPSSVQASDPGNAYAAHLPVPAVVLLGALHALSVRMMVGWGVVRGEFPGIRVPYRKFLFERPRAAGAGESGELGGMGERGEGQRGCGSGRGEQGESGQRFRWGGIRERDLELVLSRSVLPRTRALGMLPSAAVFVRASEEGGEGAVDSERKGHSEEEVEGHWQPIAWAFLGLDGSLTSLHVEPEWRGRGLAKALAAKLFREGVGVFGEPEGLMHSDVALDNKESTGVCVSLGGRRAWDCYWVRVDLDRVKEMDLTGADGL